jgi:hypothetical protein
MDLEELIESKLFKVILWAFGMLVGMKLCELIF